MKNSRTIVERTFQTIRTLTPRIIPLTTRSLGRFKDFGNLSVPADVERPQKGEKGGIVGRLVVGWVKGGGGSVSPSSDSAPPESTEITCCHVGEDKTRTRRMQAVPTSDLG
ncbi:hypothetical protein HZH66_014871 [Vespula vulgaris]|uniref:Uncharacterized protein n=1 Tax=Vespula vulgaris TaxID=7454 RepID=A0A834MNH9_VESVU|nr:hypothetical protein HZH66_014871 [Vespula vulgaris]